MKKDKHSYLRFVGLRLRDYKVFGGVNDFWFTRHRTLIVGKGGTGKTIIAEVLEHLGPPERAGNALMLNGCGGSSVSVITDGNCELIEQYRSLIFLNGEYVGRLPACFRAPGSRFMPADISQEKITGIARVIFERILYYKPGKLKLYRDLDTHLMATGEKACLGYAFVFALREALALDVPIVLDSPYAMLDQELRKGLCNFLHAQPCQQILLGHECELSKKEKPTYILVYMDKHSQVMEF